MRRLILSLAALTGLCGLVGALGWVLDLEALRTAGFGTSSMKPNTALGLLLAATALVGVALDRRGVALGGAATLSAVGLGALLSKAFGLAWVDRLVWTSTLPQQMSYGTATALLALGLGLVSAALARVALAQTFAAVSLCIALVGVAGYTLGLTSMAGSTFWSTMAAHSALGLISGASAVVLATRDGPLTRMLLGDGIAATLGRRLVVFVTVVPWTTAILLVQLGGESARASALSISQALVPAVILLVGGVLRFTSTVSRSELDLSITLDSIGDGVLLTDAEGRLVRMNPVAERLTGFTTTEAKGRPVEQVFNIINQDTREKVESPVARVIREGVVVGLANHTNLISRTGTERPIADSGAPVRSADGDLQGVVLVFRDVTEQYAAQRALSRSEGLLKSVTSAVTTGLIATREGVVVWANPAASRLLGDGAELGRSLGEYLPIEDAHVARLLDTVTAPARPPRRTRLVGAQGEVLVDLVPVADPVDLDGAPAQLTRIERVEDAQSLQLRLARQASLQQATAELSRRLSEASFDLQHILAETARLAVTSASDYALVMLFEEGPAGATVKARAASARTAQLVEFTKRFEERLPIGALSKRVSSGESLVLTKAMLQASVDPAHAHFIDGVFSSILQPMRAEGVTLGMLALGRTVERPFDDDERAFVKDLADRAAQSVRNAQLFETTTSTLATLKATEEQLRHSQKLEAVGQLAGGIAHDFNNLLSVILTLVELLLNGRAADDPERLDLEDIRSAATRAAGLTKQLLAFSRKQVMQLRPLDLNEVVRGAERLLKPLLGEDIRLTLELGTDLGLVRADANLLTQVLMNLGVNARDAMPKGGRLTLATARPPGAPPKDLGDDDFVCVTVSDEGQGMPASVLTHLFEPFFTTKGPGRGTGLGLSTSYGIVRQSGGTIEVRSTENKGSTFTVWLPLFKGGPRAATPIPVLDGRNRTGAILLVEDEPAVRDVASRLLRAAGYDVTVASGVAEGLATAAKLVHLDLLVTDVVMPDGNGRELADALLERRAGLKVVFMSGYTDDAVMQRGVSAGTVRLLQKPFTQHTLLSAVAGALT